MAGYQPDSTFFEEDDTAQYPRMDAREAVKLIARQKQEMIACELSRLDGDEYLEDIMEHLRQLETEMLPDAALIDMQREIEWYMRPYLIDFLIEAHAAFFLLPETLFLAVNLLDRYCSRRIVYKQHYQLVGCAALLIASKYGDKKENVPQISDLNNMCCGLYDAGMFTQMETHVLNTLDWAIGYPTVDLFTQVIATHERDDKQVETLAAYMCEIALYRREFVSTKPSVMARASLALARTVLRRPEVPDANWQIEDADGTTRLALSQALHGPSPTLFKKYAGAQYGGVAETLKEFLKQQVAMARRAEAAAEAAAAQAALQQQQQQPPTPPSEPLHNKHHADVYGTPVKGHGMGVPAGMDGYMTPPITPEGSCFNGGQDAAAARSVYGHGAAGIAPPRCPVTPTPSHAGFNMAQHNQHHQQQHYQQQQHSTCHVQQQQHFQQVYASQHVHESYPMQMDIQ